MTSRRRPLASSSRPTTLGPDALRHVAGGLVKEVAFPALDAKDGKKLFEVP